jgi:hypothetical protein
MERVQRFRYAEGYTPGDGERRFASSPSIVFDMFDGRHVIVSFERNDDAKATFDAIWGML